MEGNSGEHQADGVSSAAQGDSAVSGDDPNKSSVDGGSTDKVTVLPNGNSIDLSQTGSVDNHLLTEVSLQNSPETVLRSMEVVPTDNRTPPGKVPSASTLGEETENPPTDGGESEGGQFALPNRRAPALRTRRKTNRSPLRSRSPVEQSNQFQVLSDSVSSEDESLLTASGQLKPSSRRNEGKAPRPRSVSSPRSTNN